MYRYVVSAVLVALFTSAVAAADRIDLDNSQPNQQELSVNVLESNGFRTVIQFNIGSFGKEPVEINGRTFYKIALSQESTELTTGYPELPSVSRSIVIPDDAEVQLNVLASEYIDFPNTPVAPSKGMIRVGDNPDDIPYTFGDVYGSSGWFALDLAALGEPYHIRQLRGITVRSNPFQYNPESEILRVYTSIRLEITSSGGGPTPFTRFTSAPEFSFIKSHFINYEHVTQAALGKAGNVLEDELSEMLIITHDEFADDLAAFVEWKNQKGIKTTVLKVREACGGNVTPPAIKTLIQNFYDTDNNLTYVLFVGDDDQVPSFNLGEGRSDYEYSLLTIGGSTDDYPDLIVGRFSAETSAHVLTQVQRSLDYERSPQGQDWFAKAAGVADDFTISQMNNIRTLLLGKYSSVDAFNFGGDPVEEIVIRSQFTAAINDDHEGRSLINYAGHGWYDSWTGVSIGESHFADNQGRLPFIFSMACLPGCFNYSSPCFAERLLRKTSAGSPVGAVAAYMSSIIQTYPPANYAVDAFNQALVSDADRGTFGELCYYSAVTMIDHTTSSSGVYLAKGWVVFGDPSLEIRRANPTPVIATHDASVNHDAAYFNVSVRSGDGADTAITGARCGLYQSGIMYGTAITGIDGTAQIIINQDILTGTAVTLTVSSGDLVPVQHTVQVNYTTLVVTTDPLPAATKYCIQNPKSSEPDGYLVLCHAYTPNAITAGYPKLGYAVDGGPWQYLEMSATVQPNEYAASIPYQQPGAGISYRIEAADDDNSVMTDIMVFDVIDYGVLFSIDDVYEKSEQYNQSVTFRFTVTNDGVRPDIYNLAAASQLGWSAEIQDLSGTSVSVTPVLQMDESYDFQVSVTVLSTVEGEIDDITVTAVSTGDTDIPPVSGSVVCRVESEGAPLNLPFVETFPTGVLDASKWANDCTMDITDEAIFGEYGSADYSIRFQSISLFQSDCIYSSDYLTSKPVDLGDLSYASVVIFSERKGSGDPPESGDDLVVEYLNNVDEWRPLLQVPGAGPDMTDFDSILIVIPEDGLHRRSRIRVSSIYDYDNGIDPSNHFDPRDTWFVDDLSITHPTLLVTTVPLTATEYCVAHQIPGVPDGYLVEAMVFADNAMVSGYPRVAYQVNGGDWQYVVLAATGTWFGYSGSIPYQSGGDEIIYRVEALDALGNSRNTEDFLFSVNEYSLVFALDDVPLKSELYGNSVDFHLIITNGCFSDAYNLSWAGPAGWTVQFFNLQDIEITSTPILNAGDTYSCVARITVGTSIEGVYWFTISATSTQSPDPKPTSVIRLQVVSDGEMTSFPFIEPFASGTLDLSKWNVNPAMEINANAVNEPSAPYSLRLGYSDGFEGEPYFPNAGIISSDFMNISGIAGDIIVSYAYEEAVLLEDPEDTDSLVVEYLDQDSVWNVLGSHLGTCHAGIMGKATAQLAPDPGCNGTEFVTAFTDPVPPEDRPSRFKIRIRDASLFDPGDNDGLRDMWYVDNITISYPVPAVSPTLDYPPNAANYTNASPLLQWTSSGTTLFYQVMIDNDFGFGSPHASAVVKNPSWQVTPALSLGTYYWKVRSSNDSLNWSDWSAASSYTYYVVYGGGCPFVSTWNGSEYVEDNTILTQSELTGGGILVTDYYRLRRQLVPEDGEYRLMIKEFEQEKSYIDALELIAVDHPLETRVGVSPKGEIFSYQDENLAVAGRDDSEEDILGLIADNDGILYSREGAGTMFVEFMRDASSSGQFLLFSPAYSENQGLTRPAPPLKKGNPGAGVEVSIDNANGIWHLGDILPPRANPEDALWLLNPGSTPGDTGRVKVILKWSADFVADQITCYRVSAEPGHITSVSPTAAVHSESGEVLNELTNDDGTFSTLLPGGEIEVGFSLGQFPAIPEGWVRDFILRSHGYYEPLGRTTPDRFALLQNQPNPFNAGTNINFALPEDGPITLEVYDILGRRVRTLVNEFRPVGRHCVHFDGRDQHGTNLASGIYFYHLKTSNATEAKKMILLR
jgi:gingipain R